VYESGSERCSDWLPAHETARLLTAGVVSVRSESSVGVIAVERIAGARVTLSDAHVGSFGIQREHKPVGRECGLSGGVIYSHRQTWEGALAA
jgi:hypothetical protein